MLRFFKHQNHWKAAETILAQRRCMQHVTQYQWSTFCGRRHAAIFFRSCNYSRKFPSVFGSNNAATQHARTTWTWLFKLNSNKGIDFSRISTIAKAFILAFTRSHLLAPGIFTFICGQLAETKSWAEPNHFPPTNSLYMRAQHGHAFLTSLFLSFLEGLFMLGRALYLMILFLPAIASAPLVDHFGLDFRKKWLVLVHCTLERAGPAFIKWGQWAATRPDLFPRDLCIQLEELHSKAPQHSFSHTKSSIESAFGRDISDIFEDFNELPVASGSIAQVHRATLKSNHSVVAVKVRHPRVGELIRRDFAIIKTAAEISKLIPALKWLRLDEGVKQFAVFMMSQVDLSREAAHLSRFIYNFRKWKHVSFPKPLYPFVHPSVLVETFEDGDNVSHYLNELEGHHQVKSAVAHIGTHALLKMLMVDNFIHADLHPGNVIVRVAQNPRKQPFKSKPDIVFVDVGMIAELSKSDRVNLLGFFRAVALKDGRTAAECTLRLAKQQNCPNAKGFIKEVETTFDMWDSLEDGLVHPADCIHHLLEQMRRHRVNIDGNVCTVIVTTLVLEGWQRKLDAGFDFMKTLQKVLLKSDWAESFSYTIEGIMAP